MGAPAVAGVPKERSDFVQILAPLSYPDGVAGGFGTFWRTELFLLSKAPEAVTVSQRGGACSLPTCGLDPFSYPPGTYSRFTDLAFDVAIPNPGVLLYVEREFADSVDFDLRLYEESVAQQPFGIGVPVVRREAARGSIDILNVPFDPIRRVHLRIYELNGSATQPVQVRVYGSAGDELGTFVLQLAGSGKALDPVFPPYPGFAQILNLAERLGNFSEQHARIEITSYDPSLLLWAFVSVTDNQNQSVTIIAPND